jgi:hypothetical protein
VVRRLCVLVLAAFLGGCATYEFEHEFWVHPDGSGSFEVTAPPRVWNAVKNVGDARNIETSVNVESVGALFNGPEVRKLRVRQVARDGRPFITVSADFDDINALAGTKAFPDLVVSLRREGRRLRLFGVWRRPQHSGAAGGNDEGLMAVRFHMESEIFEHRNASAGVERGNVLAWTQDLASGMSGAPIDFGATIGTTSVPRATPGLIGLAILTGVSIPFGLLYFFARRRKGRRGPRRKREAEGEHREDAFLNYDPGSQPRK